VRKGDEIIWGDTAEELYRHFTPKEIKMGAKPKSFTFIAANLSDNQVLCRNDPNYYSNLLSLNPIEKAQLLDGNWDASYSDLGEIINRRDFTRYDLNYLMTIPAYFIESYFVIDSASKITTYADYSVIMFIAKDRNHKIYIIDIVRKKLEEPDLEQEIIDIYNYWKSKKTGQQPVFQIKGINIEDKSSGISMIQRLQRRNMPIYKLKPHKDKFLRLNDGLGLIKNGVVCVPEHAQWADKFFEECENFRANMKHVVMRGERLPHDDQVDTLAYAISTQVNCMPSVTAYTPLHIREKIKNKQKNTLRNKLYGFD
jgi:predicted phage terminase large subunit-like protein